MRSQALAIGSVRMFRLAFGSLLSLAGMALLLAQGLAWLNVEPRMLRALESGAVCALGTALGAVPVLVIRSMALRLSDALLGFGAGVMLAATAFSLIVPGLDAARHLGFSPWGAGALMSAGIVLGALGLVAVDHGVSKGSPDYRSGYSQVAPRIWLIVIAIIAHNIPEGLAIGVSAGGGLSEANSLAVGIALQDVPEGLMVAMVLAGAGMSRVKSFAIGVASGLVEPLFAVLGAWLVTIAQNLLPLALAMAAGAMLLVVIHEIIPESRLNGHHRTSSLSLIIGFCLMMALDTTLV